MKTPFLALATGVAIIAMSSMAFADDNCDWKKRGDHKGMSAEAWQQYKKDHGWHSSKEYRGHDGEYKEHMKEHGKKMSSDGVEI